MERTHLKDALVTHQYALMSQVQKKICDLVQSLLLLHCTLFIQYLRCCFPSMFLVCFYLVIHRSSIHICFFITMWMYAVALGELNQSFDETLWNSSQSQFDAGGTILAEFLTQCCKLCHLNLDLLLFGW